MDNPRVFLDVSVGEEPVGRLVIELFKNHAPKTVENFRQLCTGEHNGLSYTKTPFHRVIDEFMIQGGDIEKGDGTGTASIYGGEFEDENLHWREIDAAGLVCSANRGKDTNGSQFFITLDQSNHLNGKHTIFGRLVAGEDILKKIALVAVDDADRPITPVRISRCGELERRKKAAPLPSNAIASDSQERGRRRRSDQDALDGDTDESPPPNARRLRRQSDNVVDEGIRGRPRARSKSRVSSDAISEDDEDSVASSPAKKHKRKRSISPSRHVEPTSHDADEDRRRRRRSLPNQYKDRIREDDRYRPSPRRDSHRYAGHRNEDDRYRPSRDRYRDAGRLDDDGRLGGSSYSENEPPVQFKGRGVMKYRENRHR